MTRKTFGPTIINLIKSPTTETYYFLFSFSLRKSIYDRKSKPKPRPSWSGRPHPEYDYYDAPPQVRKRNGFGEFIWPVMIF